MQAAVFRTQRSRGHRCGGAHLGPGAVKVAVAYNGICGTDLHEHYSGPIFVPTAAHPLTGRQLPVTLGPGRGGAGEGPGSGSSHRRH